jgi:hypothetical protein
MPGYNKSTKFNIATTHLSGDIEVELNDRTKVDYTLP